MKLAKIINVFNTTEVLAGDPNLTHAGKWVLYSVRKQLADHSEFQREELQKLFEKYPATYNAETRELTFKSTKARDAFLEESKKLDDLEIEINIVKQKAKLSDIPGITIQQMEAVEDFIDFIPEAPVEPEE